LGFEVPQQPSHNNKSPSISNIAVTPQQAISDSVSPTKQFKGHNQSKTVVTQLKNYNSIIYRRPVDETTTVCISFYYFIKHLKNNIFIFIF
jgi:hypothetical protein